VTSQVVQLAGALLALLAYLLAQGDVWSPSSYRYLFPNSLGSSALAVNAVDETKWGFVLREGAWTLVSAWSLIETPRGQEPERRHSDGDRRTGCWRGRHPGGVRARPARDTVHKLHSVTAAEPRQRGCDGGRRLRRGAVGVHGATERLGARRRLGLAVYAERERHKGVARP
jgi:hypothetical protein